MVDSATDGGGGDSALDTFPKLLLNNAVRFRDAHATREKEFGIWQSWTWHELSEGVQDLACGLAELGFQRGDKIAIIGDNRPRLYAAMCAAQALGGIPVPMYQDAVANELQYVVDHAEVRFAIVENQEQVDKLLEIKDSCPRLECIVYANTRGLRNYEQDFLHSYQDVQEKGRARRQKDAAFLTGEIAKGKGFGYRHHPLYLRNHRQTQRRHPEPGQHSRDGQEHGESGWFAPGRRSSRLSTHGMGR